MISEKSEPAWLPSELSGFGGSVARVRRFCAARVLDSCLHGGIAVPGIHQPQIWNFLGKAGFGESGVGIAGHGPGKGHGFRCHAINCVLGKVAGRSDRTGKTACLTHQGANAQAAFTGLLVRIRFPNPEP